MKQNRDHPVAGRPAVQTPPVFNAPMIVVVVITLLAVAHFGLGLLPRRLEVWAQTYGAVSPKLFLAGPSAYGGILKWITPLFAHIFIHANLMHLLLNSVWLLAFGAPVARWLNFGRSLLTGSGLFFSLFILSGVAGALTYVAVHPDEYTLLVGASGGVSGLLGALVRFAFHRPERGEDMYAKLNNRQVLVWSLLIIGLNLALGVFGGLFTGGRNEIAWEAHVGGYLFGLLTFPFFDAPQRRMTA